MPPEASTNLLDVALGRAGEGSLFVAEQIRLDQIFRHRAAIDRNERLRPPLAGAVDRARDELLADAGFAGDQYRDARGRCLLRHAQRRLHGGALGDDVLEAERAGAAVLDAVEFAFERAGVERVAQAHLQPLGADRLDHEIDRARAHRRDDVVDAAMRGLDDDRRGDGVAAQPREHAEAVEVRHHQIEDHTVDARAVRAGEQRRRRVAAFCRDHLVAEFLLPCLRGAGAARDRHRR